MRIKMSWTDSFTQLLFASGALGSGPDPELFSGFEMPNGISMPSFSFSAGQKAVCMTGKIPIHVEASNFQIHVALPTDQYQTTDIFVKMMQTNSNFSTTALGVPTKISGTYEIFSKLCFPNNASAVANMETIQFLTHGATLDHTYWDTAPGYSYVDAAAEAGHATFSYDRLGTGLSDHPDPLKIVQAPLQVEVSHMLIQLLRGSSNSGRKFKHLAGVGHSAGSAIMQGVTTKYPEDFDAVILTGTSTSLASLNMATAGFATELARLDPSGRFSALPNGYFSQGAVIQAVQFSFWAYPHFDTQILLDQFNHRQTNTLGELLTLGTTFTPSTSYTGPIDVVDGNEDFVFCGGDCSSPTNQAQLVIDIFYPVADLQGSQTFLQPQSGHMLAQHHNAQQGFSHMLEFLRSNGFA